ncbi:MAG: flagellar hook-length control protein FliK [Desulfovibrio sp.]|jgi:flagellar hook-length control protein FliK|nr:flagellar hook-length control protein FliK [Desulfovibrio sp.]
MQFLPTDITSLFSVREKAQTTRDALPQALGKAGGKAKQAFEALTGDKPESAAEEFRQLLHEAVAAVDSGEELSAETALRDTPEARPLAQGPYSRHTTDGVTYSLDEVCFTKKELLELRRELLKAGAPEEALKHFDILAGQPDGATLAQVMAGLRQMTSPWPLSNADKANITALLGGIDPTGTLAEQALGLMEEGKGQAALALISEIFATLDNGDGVEMSKDQLLSLGKGLGLETKALRGIAEAMGGHEAGLFNSAGFNTLMAPAQAQFAAENANQGKINAALESTLKPVIARARARMEKEKAASALQDRKVEQTKTHIEKTVLRKSRQHLEAALLEGQNGHNQSEYAQGEAGAVAHSDATERRSEAKASDKNNGEREPARTAPRGENVKSAAAAPRAEGVGMPLKTGNAETPAPRNTDIVSARLYREEGQPAAQRESGTPASQTTAQTLSSQEWLAGRMTEQGLRAVSEAAPPELRFAGQTASRGETATSRRAGPQPVNASTPPLAVEIKKGESRSIQQSEERSSVVSETRNTRTASAKIISGATDGGLEKSDSRITRQSGERAAAIQAAPIAEKAESAAMRQNDASPVGLAARLAPARSVDTANFVEAGNGGRPSDDNTADNAAQDRRNAKSVTASEKRNIRMPFSNILSGAADAGAKNARQPGARPVEAFRPAEETRVVAELAAENRRHRPATQNGAAQGQDRAPDHIRPVEKPKPAETGTITQPPQSATPSAARPDIPFSETPRPFRTDTPANAQSDVPAAAARQMEESLQAALRDGFASTTRLDLQLHPQELGAISIILISRNGEVTARIRADKDETAEMLAHQAETVRINLEAQGVKVEKIEVRTNSPSGDDTRDNGGQGENSARHHERQEKDSLRDDLFRLRTLANIRNSFENHADNTLEQPVHYTGQTARYAHQALHLVA